MSKVSEGNGSGNGVGGLLQQSRKRGAQLPPAAPASGTRDSRINFQASDGLELHGLPVQVTRHHVVFELSNPTVVPRLSEALQKFEIVLRGLLVYSGPAVVRNLVDASSQVVCEATLDEAQWTDLNQVLALQQEGRILKEFESFLQDWQKFYTVSPEFKIVIADMQTFLYDLRLWLGQVELGIQALPADEQKKREQQILEEIGRLFVPAFDILHEKLEAASGKISHDLRPAHRLFAQRQLHPLTLGSPFGRRAYEKPLGYAGDYEMVNMIALNPYQGKTLFDKIVNLWFLSQWPSRAHRNRLLYLKERLEDETRRALRNHQKARIYNFACGPAIEVQRFLADFQFNEEAELTLADFNQETLDYVTRAVRKIKDRLSLGTSVKFQRKSVYQILKENQTKPDTRPEYDFIYCAGLFDYLPDTTCRQLMEAFYGWLAPGGLLVVTNVMDNRPFRHMLEFVLDWYLIYRNVEQGAGVIPESIPADARNIKVDSTGVNIFIEVRKPRE
ncbi:MAG TPA: class I SAM-dependent methyltransferase [Candidatus Acidoferrales bacterium]|nr:class I SAM-dependent methyltransferase [Candidatus Acidoferrales bacterium]